MTRSTTVHVGAALAVILSLLAASVGPVGAATVAATADGLVVGSQHATDTEFGNAKTLDNVSIVGSGDSAYVELTGSAVDSFEDNDLTEYGGDTGSFTTQSTLTTDGAYALNGTASGSQVELMSTSGLPAYPSQGDSFSWSMRTSDASGNGDHVSGAFGVQSETTGADRYRVVIVPNDNSVYLQKFQSGSLTTLDSTNPSVSANTWYTPSVDWQTDGTINVTITDENGNEVTTLGAKDTAYSSGGIGFDVNSDSDGNTGTIDDYTLQSGGDRGVYVHNHSVTNSEQAAVNLTLENATATVTISEAGSGTVLNQTTFDTTGNHTLTWPTSSADTVETNVTFETTGSNPTARFDDESILFTNHKPAASNFSPSDGTKLTTKTATFSVDINDTEFSTTQGDEVTAELFLDGSSIGTKTRTSNGTVSITTEITEGGNHTYYWELTDDYSATTTTAKRTVQSPSELFIRSETDPGTLVTGAQVNITYYYGDEIVRRNTSDGSVNLTGLPIDQPIVALADANGYHTRTAVITSVYDQESIYLLNSSLSSYQLIFDISDPTGAYSRSDTVLMVQRDIELNGSTEWRTVAGDIFGAQGVTTDLQAGERYRLVIQNLDTNERAVLGSFTPTASQTVTLEPESATVDVDVSTNVSIGYTASRNSNGDAIVVEYSDPEQSTSELKFMIHERYNESNVLLSNQTFTDLGNITYSEPLNATEQNTSWVVEFYWTKSSGATAHAQAVVGQGTRHILPGILDSVWRVSAGVTALLITALLFSQLNIGVGAITTALTGGLLWYLGLLDGVTTGPAVVLAIAVGGLIHYNSGGGAPQ